MTNAVDVLAVGGPANGRVVCMNREPSIPAYAAFLTMDGEVTYTRRKWEHPVTGLLYHILTRDEDAVDDAQVIWEITVNNFPPAWDLNR